MREPPAHPRDPFGLCVLIALAFLALCLVRLTIPSQPFFDEVHYLPAARAVLALSHPLNVEHPPLGKEMIALGMALFGDGPLGWRIMPALFGTLAVFAGMRAMWFASCSRVAAVSLGVLLLTGPHLLIHARIAMLDVFMAGFALLALWMCAGALRENETARWRLAVAGVALGCAMASKWNAIPLAVLPGLTFLVARVASTGRGALTARRGWPVGGMTLAEAGLWLGVVPLAVYAATYWPAFLYARDAIPWDGLVELHRRMLHLQTIALDPHPYQSTWLQWVGNSRAIWYLYEEVDGAWRGVLMVGNPLTMLLGLPALAWCLWAGLARRRWDALAVAVLYGVSLALWIAASKNVQFYYHYLLPSCFLLAALALALDALWKRGKRVERAAVLAVLAGASDLFVYFWPVLSAAELPGRGAFQHWTWIRGWR